MTMRSLHGRLTLLFTAVSTAILTAMSVLFLSTQIRNLRETARSGFVANVQLFAAELEKGRMLSYDWLQQMQDSYGYLLYGYDNGVPLRFTTDTKTAAQQALLVNVRQAYTAQCTAPSHPVTVVHQEFSATDNGVSYDCSRITVPGTTGATELYLVYALDGITAQAWRLRLLFAGMVLLAGGLLLAFSWVYTGHLLQPIQTAQEQQTAFIAAASHEIRNPVNTIRSALTAMTDCDTQQRQTFLSIAQKEGERLTRLTNDLLTLARSDAHSFGVQIAPTELDTLVLECYEAFVAPATAKHIHLTVSLPESTLPLVPLDNARIRQVLSILLDNALSYTPSGGTVCLSCAALEKAVRLTVADNGVGIPATAREQIFTRFYRADPSRNDDSHFGLGLSIAKELVQLHHGSIRVTDTVGGGTTFVVELPIHDRHA